jgi:peptidoglycan hydrolase-like protein with peptidoglycan-binding domain
MKTIKLQSRGSDVKKWQEFLKSKRYRITPDGVFGPQTEKATKNIQRKNKLKADGVVGPNTWKLMGNNIVEKPPTSLKPVNTGNSNNNFQVLKKGSFGEQVKQWQLFLQSAGYKIPFVDGAFGPETERETIKFQVANGLKADGVVGPKTWQFITTVSQNTPLSQRWPKQDYTSMVNFYGPVGENQTQLEVPYKLKLAWSPNIELTKITCHEKVAKSLYTIFEKTLNIYGEKELKKLRLDLFGGCLNVRKMRGGSAWSIHSWGAAIDLDPDNNQLKWSSPKAKFSAKEYEAFWKIVEAEGWTSLGRERNYDWMHFQAAYL